MHPIFDELSVKYKNVIFLRVDSDRNRNLSGEYGITGLPTFVFVVQGNEVDRVVGADPNSLEGKINQYASMGNTFSGTGMALGGTSVDPAKAREIRLKKFGRMRAAGPETASKMTDLMNKMKEDLSEDEEEIKADTFSCSRRLMSRERDRSLRDTLLSMGFSAANVDKVSPFLLLDCRRLQSANHEIWQTWSLSLLLFHKVQLRKKERLQNLQRPPRNPISLRLCAMGISAVS